MEYLATYYNRSKPVCNTTVNAESAEEAEIIAEFKIAAFFPNVEWDTLEIWEK